MGSALLRPPLSQHGLGFLPESRAVRNLSPQASTSDGQMPSGASHGCRTASTAVGNTGFQTRLGPGGLCKQWGSQAGVLHGHRAGVHPNRRPTRDGRALPAGCSPGSTAVASGATRGGADPGERLPSWGRGDPPTTWFVPRSTLSSKCPTAPPPMAPSLPTQAPNQPQEGKRGNTPLGLRTRILSSSGETLPRSWGAEGGDRAVLSCPLAPLGDGTCTPGAQTCPQLQAGLGLWHGGCGSAGCVPPAPRFCAPDLTVCRRRGEGA